MTRNNESNRVGQFFTRFFPDSCITRSFALHDLFTFFTKANALFTDLLYAGAVSKRFQPTNAIGDLSHIYESYLLQN